VRVASRFYLGQAFDIIGAPGTIRTSDPQIRSLVLYRGIDHFMLKYAHTEQQHYPERTGFRLPVER
jgi:hypothetical protein